jgi:hypothetical protein
MIMLSTPVINWAILFLAKMVKTRMVGIIPSWDELVYKRRTTFKTEMK